MDIDRDDDGDSEDQPEAPVPTSKRRKLDAFSEGAELVASWDLSQGVRKMASGYTTPGRQMSVLQALERRLLGFKASSAQGTLSVTLGNEDTADAHLISVDETSAQRLHLKQ